MIVLYVIGLALHCARRVASRFGPVEPEDFEAIPLDDISDDGSESSAKHDIPGEYVGVTPLGARGRRYLFYLIIACLVSRVEVARRVAEQYQCTHPGLEVCYPAVPAVIS